VPLDASVGRGGSEPRPYETHIHHTMINITTVTLRDNNNPMHVVGHDDERIQLGMRVMHRQLIPAAAGDLTFDAQMYLTVDNPGQRALTPIRADSDEIRAGVGVIPCGQTNRAAMMAGAVVGHGVTSSPCYSR